MRAYINDIINNPTVFLSLLFFLAIIFFIGYFLAWFFKGGVIRFLLGLFLSSGIVISIVQSDATLNQIAFFGGFFMRLFNYGNVFMHLQDKYVGHLVSTFEKTTIQFLDRFLPSLTAWFRRVLIKNSRSENEKKGTQQDNADDDTIAKEQARRAEEIKRERARRKDSQTQRASKSSHDDRDDKKAGKQANKSNGNRHHSGQRKRDKNYQGRRNQNNHSDSRHNNRQHHSTSNRKSRQQSNHKANQSHQKSTHRQRPTPPPNQPTSDKRTDLEILGLVEGQTYTADEIKKAYREQSKKVHPDKWQGKPQVIIDEMEREMTKINRAYENLK